MDQSEPALYGKLSFTLSIMALNIEVRPPVCSPVMAIHRRTLTSIMTCIFDQARLPDLPPDKACTSGRKKKKAPPIRRCL